MHSIIITIVQPARLNLRFPLTYYYIIFMNDKDTFLIFGSYSNEEMLILVQEFVS
jgi:hypothetical protein